MSPTAVDRLNAALSGRYHIESELGEGGMATVYLADDLKHERKVALKVLKPELAAVVGAERFLAEIKTTANLQHPHILPLHDSGEADSFLYYVMPYIEGETLRERIDRERQLPVDEALGIATAVANALHTAHEQGVIHRDIKPGNILMSRGEPLVADFGIALVVSAGGSGRLTETGLSLGTPYYMSPEQATGDQAVGPASDTFALACVLYEMLVGEPPYPGSTAQAVLGKIILGLPVSATAIRQSVPANVDATIRKALEKVSADRFTGAQDFARALADPGFRHGTTDVEVAGAGVGPWKRATIGATAIALAFAAAFVGLMLWPDPPLPVTRVAVEFSEDQELSGLLPQFDISLDGSRLLYRGPGPTPGSSQLWVRDWAALEATPIRGTDAGRSPALSPDGQEVAFPSEGSIRVVATQGGIPRTVAAGSARCCPRWSPDGAWLYFNNPENGVSRVPSGGGSVEVVTEVDAEAGDIQHLFIDVLPDGQAALYQTTGALGPRISAVSIESGEVRELTPGSFPRYSQRAPTLH